MMRLPANANHTASGLPIVIQTRLQPVTDGLAVTFDNRKLFSHGLCFRYG